MEMEERTVDKVFCGEQPRTHPHRQRRLAHLRRGLNRDRPLGQLLHHAIGKAVEIALRNLKRIPLPYSFLYVLFFVHRMFDV